MTIRPGVNLGEAFEQLKSDLIRIEKTFRADTKDTKYAAAYGSLSACVQHHIAWNTDESYHFLSNAVKTPENGSGEAPTLLLYDALHWLESDIPDELFSKPNIHP